MNTVKTIDEYIMGFDPAVQERLVSVRSAIQASVPEATEAISYGMPTFRLNGKNMVHFAGFAHHIGFYAAPAGHAEFEPELLKYKRGKGSVQFPLDEPLPLDLIRRITVYKAKLLSKGA